MARRDEVDGDKVAVYIDSYFDKRTAFAFKVNAAGVKGDAALSGDSPGPGLHLGPGLGGGHRGRRRRLDRRDGHPLQPAALRQQGEMTFGLQVRRFLYRDQELSSWQHIAKDAPGFVHHFGELRGLQGIKAQHQIEIIPYAVAKGQLSPKEAGNPFATGSSGRLFGGLDGKVGLSSDLTLDFTINPDFGQVEADPSVVNLSAYETYFQEKRPFFTEGRNILDFRIMGGDGDFGSDNLFYSRRIGRAPQYSPETRDRGIPGHAHGARRSWAPSRSRARPRAACRSGCWKA